MKTGDRVVTASGIHGLISNVKDRTVIVKIADNVKIEMEKSAVTNVVNRQNNAHNEHSTFGIGNRHSK